MVKQGKKKTAKKASLQSRRHSDDTSISNKESQFEERLQAFNVQEVERHIIALQAIKNAEIENVLSRCRLVRSYLTKEQLQTPAIEFFKENCPNILLKQNEKYPFYELQWKNETGLVRNVGNEVPASVGKLAMPSTIDLGFSARSVKTDLMNAAGQQILGFAFAETPETRYPGLNSFQTPRVMGQRLSLGATPKTQRQPKHGEMLLSEHGSPLGVYKDNKLEAINESEDGPPDSIN